MYINDMGIKIVSLRISEKLCNELHRQSIKQSVTITKFFWAMRNNHAMRDAEINNLEQENIENSEVNTAESEMNIGAKPEMEIEVAKNIRNKHVYVEGNKEKNNIIKWLGQNGIFLDDNYRTY